MKPVKYILLPVIMLGIIYIFFYQPEILGVSLIENGSFPLGSLVSWLIITIIPLFLYLVLPFKKKSKTDKFFRYLLLINVILGLLWGLLSYFLAGNWTFTFTNNQSGFFIWISITAFVVLSSIIAFVIWTIRKILY